MLIEAETVDVNITPLIDVVFLLLIFFMVTTTFVESPSINVNLPKAATKAKESKKSKNLVVSVNTRGQIFLGEKRLSMSEFKSEAQKFSSENKSGMLVLRADKTSQHGEVVEIMDIAKSEGITKIAIATTPTN